MRTELQELLHSNPILLWKPTGKKCFKLEMLRLKGKWGFLLVTASPAGFPPASFINVLKGTNRETRVGSEALGAPCLASPSCVFPCTC